MDNIDIERLKQNDFYFEVASTEELRIAEERNTDLLIRLTSDLRMRQGENLHKLGPSYLIDIFDSEHRKSAVEEAQELFDSISHKIIFKRFRHSDFKSYGTRAAKYIVFNKRSELLQYPVPDSFYTKQPYIFQVSSSFIRLENRSEEIFNQVSGVFINEPALVLAETMVEDEPWVYLRTTTSAGWIKDKQDTLTYLPKSKILFDPVRPYSTKERIRQKGLEYGTVTAFGLKINEGTNELIPVNDLNSNAESPFRKPMTFEEFKASKQSKNESDVRSEYEQYMSVKTYGEGILETGETALLSMGNKVLIARSSKGDDFFTVITPDNKRYDVSAKYVNFGTLKPTQLNVEKLVQRANGRVYRWKDTDGVGFNSSGFIRNLMSSFGIITPNTEDAQRYGLAEDEHIIAQRKDKTEDWRNYLPVTIDDLKSRGLDIDVINWGFTTLSWGTHTMLMLGHNEDGKIIYAHTIGPFKDTNDANPSKKLYRTIVGPADNAGTYYFDKENKRIGRHELPTNTFSPYLYPPNSRMEPDRSRISMVRWF
jgi:hypothetical protein